MEYVIIFIRIISIMLLLLFCTLLIMGKRPIGELPVFDFLALIVMGAIVGADIADPTIKHLPTAFAVIILALFQRVISTLMIRSRRFNKWLTFEPTIIIRNGQLIHKNIKKIKYSVEEVLMLLREKQVFDIGVLEYAIVESSGKLTILKKSEEDYVRRHELDVKSAEASIPLVVILEKKLIRENLHRLNITEDYLLRRIKEQGYHHYNDLFFVSLDKNGTISISPYGVKEDILIT